MAGARSMNWVDKLGNFWPVVPYVVAPVLIARFLCRGRWIEILQAYGIWIGCLALFGFVQDGQHAEGYGWAFLIALFATVFAIPIFVVLLKLQTYIWNRG